jgi:acyl carrier protein
MTRDEIYTRLGNAFAGVLGGSAYDLHDTTTAQDVEGWDSLNHVNLIVAIECAFGISLTTREAKRLRNVGDLVTLIGQKVG